MTKIKQVIQGGVEPDVFLCYCGEYSYLRISRDEEDEQVYVSIVGRPVTIGERLSAAWRCLLGKEFYISNEVIVDAKDLPALRKALTMGKKND